MPATTESEILEALNDDCVCSVFQWLDLPDIFNVAGMCSRFERLAKLAFASTYKKLKLNCTDCDRNQMVEILQLFGQSIHVLSIHSDRKVNEAAFLQAVIQNCAQSKGLSLFDFHIQVNPPDMNLQLIKLKELSLYRCTGNLNMDRLIENCSEITEIVIDQCHLKGLDGMLRRRRIQKLKKMYVHPVGDQNAALYSALELCIQCSVISEINLVNRIQ